MSFLYFNTKGTSGGNPSIKKLLNYIQESKISNVTDEATQKLHDCVSKVKVSPEMRLEYMTWEEKIFYERLDAKTQGHKEGLEEERMRLVIAKLNKGKRSEEIADELELPIEEVNQLVELLKN